MPVTNQDRLKARVAKGACRLCDKPALKPTQACAYHQLLSRLRMIQYYYGLTYAEYQEMVERNDGKCWICNKRPFVKGLSKDRSKISRSLSVDHDHETGRVRGLLCAHCNQGIGHFRHSTQLLSNAQEYLKG